MITIVEFEGTIDEAKAAHAWCRRCTQYEYAIKNIGTEEYKIAFKCPFDAQAFRDAHINHTWPIE